MKHQKDIVTETTTSPPDTPVETERLIGATLIAVIFAAVIAFVLMSWLATEMLEGETARFDRVVRTFVNGFARPPITAVMKAASFFGGPTMLGVVGATVGLIFLVKRWWRGVVLLVVTFAGAALVDVLLKHAFERTRPEPFFGHPLPRSYSFPSGHALFAFVFFGTFAVLLMQRVERHWLRVVIWVVGTALVGLIGLSRIYLGVHYPSDVVAGYLTALVWIVVMAVADRLAWQGRFKRKPSRAKS